MEGRTEDDWGRLHEKINLVCDAFETIIRSMVTHHNDGSMSFRVPKEVVDRLKRQMKKAQEI